MTVPYDVIADVIKVLDHVSTGRPPTIACDDLNFSYNTFCTYTATYPQLRSMREQAEDRCYDVLADRLLTIHEEVDHNVLQAASANVKWLLERRRSKAYGSKSTLDVVISADKEVLDALQNAKARAQGATVIEQKSADAVLDLTILNGVASAVNSAIPSPSVEFDEFDEDRHQRELAEIS